jgi:hypothetical protein
MPIGSYFICFINLCLSPAEHCNILEHNLLVKLIQLPAQLFKAGQRSKHQGNLQSPSPKSKPVHHQHDGERETETSGAGHARRARREEIGYGNEPLTHLNKL